MEKFQQRFIEEAQEYFDSLEAVLLNLNKDLGNKQLIGEVFRIMHSLKGSGAMFGFGLLSQVTHDLESLYESVRGGRVPLDHQIINFTLNAVDKLRQLLELDPGPKEQALSEQLKKDISSFLPEASEVASPNLSSNNSINAPLQTETKERSFFVYFEPDANILSNGTNPLYLVDELCSLGPTAVKVDLSKLPDIEDFDPEICYVNWRVVLVTTEEIDAIRDVFLFVQDHSKIEIKELRKGNIFNNKAKTESCFLLPLEEVVPFENETPDIAQAFEQPKKIVPKAKREELVAGVQLSTIRVNSAKIDAYMNLVSELIIAQSQLDLLAETNKELESISEHFGKLIRQLRDNAFDMGLIPLNNMATRFKRLVHDLSIELNKEVELVTEGLETELDKNIIEKLGEPLLHILRNCIDHGIEPVDERLALGKTKAGVIIIKASYVGTFVEIEITDDGRGLDLAKIREKAIQKSLISEDEELNDSALISLIFAPGFSTTDNLSDVSGRGIGMDIVRSRIKDLRGDIEVDTKKGEGTNFTIRLPLTLSIIDGLLTKVTDDFYVFPTSTIEKIYALTKEVKRNLRRQVVVFEGREIPFLDLRNEFYPSSKSIDQQYFIAVKYENGLFGLVVDDVIREYQAVVKPLGEMLKHHDMFLGASILGDGKVSLVIDVKKTIQKFSI